MDAVTKNGTLVSQYTYDANGNRLTRTTAAGTAIYTTDNQDRLTSWNLAPDTWNLTYTPNGELQSKSNGSQTTTYQYDVIGNLRHVTLPDGTQIDYVSDGQNRRVGKKVNGALVQVWLYSNQLNPVAELDGSGNIVSTFIYASRSNVPDYMVKNAITYRIVSDHLGSPRLVINTGDGSVAQRLDYDEFGNVTQDTNPGLQPFAFAGCLYDTYTKLARFGARDYDAEVGRWTAKDPILFAGRETTLYGYAFNDPIDFLDSEGLYVITIGGSLDLILPVGGGTYEGGIYIQTPGGGSSTWGSGLYGTVGFGFGFNFGANVQGGVYTGNVSTWEGGAVNLTAGTVISGTGTYSPLSGTGGVSVSGGYSAPVAGAISVTSTGALSWSELWQKIKNWFSPATPIDCPQ